MKFCWKLATWNYWLYGLSAGNHTHVLETLDSVFFGTIKRRALLLGAYMCVTLQFNFCTFHANWPCSLFFIINIHVGNALHPKRPQFYEWYKNFENSRELLNFKCTESSVIYREQLALSIQKISFEICSITEDLQPKHCGNAFTHVIRTYH
jgi:hypothetical protein